MTAVALVSLALAPAVPAQTTAARQGASPAPTFGDPSCPTGTTVGPAVPPDTAVSLLVGFTHDAAGLEAFARAVSDPASPTRGAYAPVDDLASRFGATAAARQAFLDALATVGATGQVDVTAMLGTATLTAAQANQLFATTLVRCTNAGSDFAVATSPPPTAPAGWAGAIDVVQGLRWSLSTTVATPPPPPVPGPTFPPGPVLGNTAGRTGTPEGCPEALALQLGGVPLGLAPNQLRHAYGVDTLGAAVTGDGARAAVIAGAPPALDDVAAFAACFGIPLPPIVVHPAPGAPTQPDPEPTLDVMALLAASPGIERIDVFTFAGPDPDPTTFSATLDRAATGGRLPDVVSDSYGVCEIAYQDDANLVAQLPLREAVLAVGAAAGVGFYAAAGDIGSLCLSDTAASAWVTGVGGTGLTLAPDNTIADLGVWNDQQYCDWAMPCAFGAGAGGGGTSSVVGRPWWQTGPGVPAGTMRTAPDVAFLADPFPGMLVHCVQIACPGPPTPAGWGTGGGTSFATPFFAGAMATLAAQARSAGRPGPGFIPPTLYALAATGDTPVLRDVVLGSNGLTKGACCTATPGYDLASGLGAVDVGALGRALTPAPVGPLPPPPPAPTPVGPPSPPAATVAVPAAATPAFTG